MCIFAPVKKVTVLPPFRLRFLLRSCLGLSLFLLDARGHAAGLLLPAGHHAARAPADGEEDHLLAAGQRLGGVLLALAPAVVEEPVRGELVRVAEVLDCRVADIADRFVLRDAELATLFCA